MIYIHAKTLEDAKKIASKENTRGKRVYRELILVSSGKLHKKNVNPSKGLNEYGFKEQFKSK